MLLSAKIHQIPSLKAVSTEFLAKVDSISVETTKQSMHKN